MKAIFKYNFRAALLIFFILSTGQSLFAQGKKKTQVTTFSTTNDTLILNSAKTQSKDSVVESGFKKLSLKLNWDSIGHIHSPRRAGLYSAVFPGLGQIYNHQYIKVPLMWAGIGVATGVFVFNYKHYITFRDAYRLRLNGKKTGKPQIDIYSEQDLKYLRDGYRKYVDYSVLGFAAVYLYNVLDAVVFGYLYNFHVASPLAKVHFGPVFNPHGPHLGFGFTYNF